MTRLETKAATASQQTRASKHSAAPTKSAAKAPKRIPPLPGHSARPAAPEDELRESAEACYRSAEIIRTDTDAIDRRGGEMLRDFARIQGAREKMHALKELTAITLRGRKKLPRKLHNQCIIGVLELMAFLGDAADLEHRHSSAESFATALHNEALLYQAQQDLAAVTSTSPQKR